uniref:Uncharacterized protein n=1 Tax=Rhizophora mucronata TaxID=61149 RepID=A0A2P2J287_RHIMU
MYGVSNLIELFEEIKEKKRKKGRDLPRKKEREAPRSLAEKTQSKAGMKPKSKEAAASRKTA